jgi:asparagine synthase (glutamine-hydrolysing)
VSGILGIYHRDGQAVASADLVRMAERLKGRGPDAAGFWHEGSVGLGSRLLRTTPESLHEELPVANVTGDIVLTADARIDNRDELATALGFARVTSDMVSDSALILAAYERWGEACLDRLLGDFAFAVWDKRRRRMFCARDPMGVRPLCYYMSPKVFAFASDVATLLCLSQVPSRINEVKIADHLVPIFEDPAITFYRDVFRLPAAHGLSVSASDSRLHRYWSLDPSREIRLRSDAEYAEAFRDHFTEAVRCRLRSAGPVGALLSGGLDSSSIVCTARNLLGADADPLRTFSAIFPSLREADARIDERRYIDAVIAQGGVEPHYVRADQCSPLSEILWGQAEAIPAPNLYMDEALFGAVRQSGTRVVLSGWDGDSTVSHGLEYLAELARTGRWWALRRESRALSRRISNRIATPRRIRREFGWRPLAPDFAVRAWRSLRGRRSDGLDIIGPINPVFARRIGLPERVRSLSSTGKRVGPTARHDHWRNLTSGLLVYGLELLDQAAGACSLEARYPFCDRRLVEFCLALPAEQKLQNGWTRAVMRRAMAGTLPQDVSARAGKGNLSANFKQRLLDNERKTLEEVMSAGDELVGEYVDVGALRAAYTRYASAPLAQERDALTVFLGVTLALWFRQTRLRQSYSMTA